MFSHSENREPLSKWGYSEAKDIAYTKCSENGELYLTAFELQCIWDQVGVAGLQSP